MIKNLENVNSNNYFKFDKIVYRQHIGSNTLELRTNYISTYGAIQIVVKNANKLKIYHNNSILRTLTGSLCIILPIRIYNGDNLTIDGQSDSLEIYSLGATFKSKKYDYVLDQYNTLVFNRGGSIGLKIFSLDDNANSDYVNLDSDFSQYTLKDVCISGSGDSKIVIKLLKRNDEYICNNLNTNTSMQVLNLSVTRACIMKDSTQNLYFIYLLDGKIYSKVYSPAGEYLYGIDCNIPNGYSVIDFEKIIGTDAIEICAKCSNSKNYIIEFGKSVLFKYSFIGNNSRIYVLNSKYYIINEDGYGLNINKLTTINGSKLKNIYSKKLGEYDNAYVISDGLIVEKNFICQRIDFDLL